jgi:hypothetical protein
MGDQRRTLKKEGALPSEDTNITLNRFRSAASFASPRRTAQNVGARFARTFTLSKTTTGMLSWASWNRCPAKAKSSRIWRISNIRFIFATTGHPRSLPCITISTMLLDTGEGHSPNCTLRLPASASKKDIFGVPSQGISKSFLQLQNRFAASVVNVDIYNSRGFERDLSYYGGLASSPGTSYWRSCFLMSSGNSFPPSIGRPRLAWTSALCTQLPDGTISHIRKTPKRRPRC